MNAENQQVEQDQVERVLEVEEDDEDEIPDLVDSSKKVPVTVITGYLGIFKVCSNRAKFSCFDVGSSLLLSEFR